MATPLLRELHAHPEVEEIVGIGRRAPLEVLEGSPWIQQTVVCRGKGWKERWKAVQRIRELKLDAVLLLTNSLSTGMQAYLSGIPRRVGYHRFGRKWMLTDSIPEPKRVEKENAGANASKRESIITTIDSYIQLGKLLNCNVSDRRMELHVSDEDKLAAERLWGAFGWSDRVPTIAINSSGAYGSSKVWPEEKVMELCRKLVCDTEAQVLLNCGPAEREATLRVALEAKSPRVRSLGESEKTPLGLTKAAFVRSSVVVSTDSGPRHMAVALGKKVISLFGSTNPAATKSYNEPEKIHYLGLACQPCYKRSCPLGHHDCMKKIEVLDIFREIEREIKGNCTPGSSQGPLSEVA